MDLKFPFYLQLYEPTLSRFEKWGGFSRKSPREVGEGILCFEQEPTIMFYNAIVATIMFYNAIVGTNVRQ